MVGGRAVTLLEGPAGWGEISLLPGYPCDPASARLAAEEAAVQGWPPARRDSVACNALVTGPDIDTAALAGFGTVKVKMRTPGDVALVAAVRNAVGPRVALRVDANGAWDVETAVAVIGLLRDLDIELVEQPCPTLEDLARVRARVDVPIAADECVRSLDDARRLASLGAADAVVLKVQPLGGVRRALEIAEASGVPAIPTSMMETSVGLAAGLALAAALPELPLRVRVGDGNASDRGRHAVAVGARARRAARAGRRTRRRSPGALLGRRGSGPGKWLAVDPGRDHVSELAWAFEVNGVTSLRDRDHRRVRTDRRAHSRADLCVLAVVRAGDDEHRHLEARELIPHRLVGGLAQARGAGG